MTGKTELYIVVHAIIDGKAYADHEISPHRLLFWGEYKKSCKHIIHGKSLTVYGEARCAGVTRGIVMQLAVSYLKKYYPELLESDGN